MYLVYGSHTSNTLKGMGIWKIKQSVADLHLKLLTPKTGDWH